MPDLRAVPRFPRGVKLRFDAVRGEHFLLAPERAFWLDATAYAVVELIDGARPFDDIVGILASRFSEAREVIANDVATMLDGLIEKRVIEV